MSNTSLKKGMFVGKRPVKSFAARLLTPAAPID